MLATPRSFSISMWERVGVYRQMVTTNTRNINSLVTNAGGCSVRLSKDMEPRSIWYYEYGQFKGKQIGLKIVLVFFRAGRYDGHLWFSSKELADIEWM